MPEPSRQAYDILVIIMLIRIWRVVTTQFRRRVLVGTPAPLSNAGAVLSVVALRQIVQVVASARSDEISCEACFQQLDLYVEITLSGRDAAGLMPLMQHHLSFCRDCREEFDALLAALRAAN